MAISKIKIFQLVFATSKLSCWLPVKWTSFAQFWLQLVAGWQIVLYGRRKERKKKLLQLCLQQNQTKENGKTVGRHIQTTYHLIVMLHGSSLFSHFKKNSINKRLRLKSLKSVKVLVTQSIAVGWWTIS